MPTLFTPWRYEYIKRKGSKRAGTAGAPEVRGESPVAAGREAAAPVDETADCFFCAAGREPDDPERLVVFHTGHHLVMLNRHPYTNGHLMVAPLAHLASPRDSSPEAAAELWPLVLEAQRVLLEESAPEGFNMGLNLGPAAGAGVPGHFHFHVVPRWKGDTNFMGVVAGVRMVPQALDDTWDRLRRRFADLAGDPRFSRPCETVAGGDGCGDAE